MVIIPMALLLLTGTTALAQVYPSRPIRILTDSVGSNDDIVSRLLGQVVAQSVGQPVVIDNRQSGVVLGQIAAKAPPDGYTLMVTGATFWLAHLLQYNVPWDATRDFAPVALMTTSPNVVVVHPSLPVKTLKDLIALARAQPGKLNFSSGAGASTPHLAGELFNVLAQVDIVGIPYKGVRPAMNDLLAGQVQVMYPNAGIAASHLKSGRLRGLAVATTKSTPLFPDLPTVAAAGLEGYEAAVLSGMFAPATTPAALVQRMSTEVAAALRQPDMRKRLFNTGVETLGGAPEALTTEMQREIAVWGRVIREHGIRLK